MNACQYVVIYAIYIQYISHLKLLTNTVWYVFQAHNPVTIIIGNVNVRMHTNDDM